MFVLDVGIHMLGIYYLEHEIDI